MKLNYKALFQRKPPPGYISENLFIFCMQKDLSWEDIPTLFARQYPQKFMEIHSFWINVNQKAKVIENTLKAGLLKIQVFLYPEYGLDLLQNFITSPLGST